MKVGDSRSTPVHSSWDGRMSWGSRAIGVTGEDAGVGAANGFVAGWADSGPGSRMGK